MELACGKGKLNGWWVLWGGAGDQSSGKSSVLEALSGVHLPRGVGLVTRCPIQLNLRRAREGAQQWSGTAWVQPAGGRGTQGGRWVVNKASSMYFTSLECC